MMITNTMMSTRTIYVLGLLLVSVILLASVYLQYVENILPCPLCTLQRITFCLLGVWFFLGICLQQKRWLRRSIVLLSTVTALLGIVLSSRQIWLQHIPGIGSTDCGADLQYMAKTFPWHQLLYKVLLEKGVACSERGWEFLNLDIAEWSLLGFALLFLLTLFVCRKEFK